MLIKTKTILHDGFYELRTLDIEFCCNPMGQAFNNRFIDFGEYDMACNMNNDVNVYHCDPYPEGPCWAQMPIKLCPFCGEAIMIENIKTVKLVARKEKVTAERTVYSEEPIKKRIEE